MKKSGVIVLVLLLLTFVPVTAAAPIEIVYFYSPGCSHCRATSDVLDDIKDHYGDLVEINKYNIYLSENQDIWNDYTSRYGSSGVPVLFINDERKLAGDLKITYSNMRLIIDEMLAGIGVHGDELYNLGLAAMSDGEFDMAIDYFTQAIEIYIIAENDEKISLCNKKISDCNEFKLAQSKFMEAENYYFDGDYISASVLYADIAVIYGELGVSSLLIKIEVRLKNCFFFMTYESALEAYKEGSWQEAKDYFTAAKEYTSKKETLDAINSSIEFCDEQLYALGVYSQAQQAFLEQRYSDSKQLYNDAALLLSDASLIEECNSASALCDKFILAHTTFEYGVQLYSQESYEQSITTLESAKEKFVALDDDVMAVQCDDYILLAKEKMDVLAQIEKEREERMILYAIAGIAIVCVIVVSFFLIHRNKRAAVGSMDESEDASYYEEYEGESQ
ncbi:MAG: tetratricopeptide repeat protein [Candidatus Methanofastidiosia archaeon]